MLRAGRGACPVRFLRVGPPKASKKAVQAEPSAHYDAADAIAAMPAKELGVCVGGIPLPPPEYLTQPRTIGPQVDTWGVGVVAGYGFTAATAKIWANDSGNTRASLTLPKGLSWESKDLVALCLHR